jgi:hypothetical protein
MSKDQSEDDPFDKSKVFPDTLTHFRIVSYNLSNTNISEEEKIKYVRRLLHEIPYLEEACHEVITVIKNWLTPSDQFITELLTDDRNDDDDSVSELASQFMDVSVLQTLSPETQVGWKWMQYEIRKIRDEIRISSAMSTIVHHVHCTEHATHNVRIQLNLLSILGQFDESEHHSTTTSNESCRQSGSEGTTLKSLEPLEIIRSSK